LLGVLTASGHVLRGGMVVRRDGKSFEGIVHLEEPADAVLVRADAAAPTVRIPLADVKLAQFVPPMSGVLSGGMLRGGWVARDVGARTITGCSDYADGSFRLRGCGGGGLGESGEAFHYLYQPLPEQGQIIVRVASLSGPGASMAGVLIHGRIPWDHRFVAMVVTPDGTKCMSRSDDTEPIHTIEGGAVKTPCWLKLAKTAKGIAAWQSGDGKKWEQVAGMEWLSPAENLIGMVALSRVDYVPAMALFDQVHLTVHGLKGEYFADSKFDSLRVTRVDAAVDFNWGMGSPAASVPADGYSVSWTGQIEARSSEATAFGLDAANGARLWIDGKIILDTQAVHHRDGIVDMIAGSRYDIRIDLVKSGGIGGCRLSWGSANFPPDIVGNSQLFYVPESGVPGPATRPNPFFVATPLPATRGLVLRDGSIIPGDPVFGDRKELRLRMASGREVAVPVEEIDCINFRPMPADMVGKVSVMKAGLLTETGDVMEGEYCGLGDGKLKIISVLFGMSNVACGEVVAVRIKPVAGVRQPSKYIVRTTGGAVYMAQSIKDDIAKACITIEHALLGTIVFGAGELAEIEVP